ncbi:MAG: S26 family signal peptidase [Nitrospinae bacterium]|nr:S26 family signal peptidase [Nitrospinota bacterium]
MTLKTVFEKVTKAGYWFSVMAVVLLAPVLAVMVICPDRILINETPSIPYKVMWLSKPARLHKGAYYAWTISSPHVHGGKPFLIVKKASCIGGETLSTKGNEYFCGPFPLGTAKDKSASGALVEPFRFNGVIPEGNFFGIGHSFRSENGRMVDDSFDSRYFGLVDFKLVRSVATPLL